MACTERRLLSRRAKGSVFTLALLCNNTGAPAVEAVALPSSSRPQPSNAYGICRTGGERSCALQPRGGKLLLPHSCRQCRGALTIMRGDQLHHGWAQEEQSAGAAPATSFRGGAGRAETAVLRWAQKWRIFAVPPSAPAMAVSAAPLLRSATRSWKRSGKAAATGRRPRAVVLPGSGAKAKARAHAVRGLWLKAENAFRTMWLVRVVTHVMVGSLAASCPLAASAVVGGSLLISTAAATGPQRRPWGRAALL
ncbi:unnamed protein product, partial [Phaeothamnion confervicola]